MEVAFWSIAVTFSFARKIWKHEKLPSKQVQRPHYFNFAGFAKKNVRASWTTHCPSLISQRTCLMTAFARN